MNTDRRSLRQTFKDVTAITAGVGLASTAGCLDLLGLTPNSGSGPGGLGGGATFQDVTEEDAHVRVTSADELIREADARAGSGQIIWVESDSVIDLSGRNLTLRNVTIASGRSEGSSGAIFTTSDRGRGSSVRDNALFNLEEGARLTGLTIRGPLYNYTDSPVVPGYIPMGRGDSYDARENWRSDWYCRGVSIQSDSAQVDNCEIWGWSTGIMIGGQNTSVSPTIMYCHIHNCMMTSAGYCVDVKRGTPTVYRCTFDAYRHAINGFGYRDAGYNVVECRFGPHKSSYDIDMHGIHDNARDGGSSDPDHLRYRYRAGGTMLVRDSIIMGTHSIDERHHNGAAAGTYDPTPYVNQHKGNEMRHVHIRAVPADGFYFEGNQCARDDPLGAVHQSSIPSRYSTDENGWRNMFIGENAWGVDFGTG